MVKHISAGDWHAVYYDGEYIWSWYDSINEGGLDAQKLLQALSRAGVDFSEGGVIEEYGGEELKQQLLHEEEWPETYEELEEIRNMALYK